MWKHVPTFCFTPRGGSYLLPSKVRRMRRIPLSNAFKIRSATAVLLIIILPARPFFLIGILGGSLCENKKRSHQLARYVNCWLHALHDLNFKINCNQRSLNFCFILTELSPSQSLWLIYWTWNQELASLSQIFYGDSLSNTVWVFHRIWN